MGLEGVDLRLLAGGACILVATVGAIVLSRRDRSVRTSGIREIVQALCVLNAQVSADRNFAAVLIGFTETPEKLDRVDRVRARAWFNSARRLHRLLHEALEREGADSLATHRWAPSLGEASDPGNVMLIDPEFMAWVEAVREARGG